MIKEDIAKAMAMKLNLSQKQALELTDKIIDQLKQVIASGEKLSLSGFGRFELHYKKERIGRNPKTKQQHVISARRTVSFYPSKKLKAKLN